MKQLFVEAIDFIPFGGDECVPTVVVSTTSEACAIGKDALALERGGSLANRHFKLDLGEIDPRGMSLKRNNIIKRKLFKANDGQSKSAYEITKQFVLAMVGSGQSWLGGRGISPAGRIIVAEPLQFQVDDQSADWLQNYRAHIRRILEPHFSTIEFLPEPFAVFLYYREGRRHPHATEKKKYVALVLDFGGGTFDTSIIETTNSGEIARGGSRNKPFAAASVPIGGAMIDAMIAKFCMVKALDNEQKIKELKTFFSKAERYTEDVIEDLSQQKRSAYEWLQRVSVTAESAKIRLVSSITSWSPESIPDASVIVDVPKDPFDSESPTVQVSFSAAEFFREFHRDIWNRHLKGAINGALRRASESLEDKSINLVLLSGGSCNIRWVKELLSLDFEAALASANTISLAEDYQKIVAKGLAVECARRYLLEDGADIYKAISLPPTTAGSSDTENQTLKSESVKSTPSESKTIDEGSAAGDFDGVTYNNLYLTVRPDEAEFELAKINHLAVRKKISAAPARGVVIPAGTKMRDLLAITQEWKLTLQKSPLRKLDYLFSRTADIPAKPMDVYNTDQTVYTRGHKSFGANIWVQLSIREDATCEPTFIYRKATETEEETRRIAVPFALDMTDFARPMREVSSDARSQVQGPVALEDSLEGGSTLDDKNAPSMQIEADRLGRTTADDMAFFGFDFGTTNSSLSFISRRSVELTEDRAGGAGWKSLIECVDDLPATISFAAKRYLAPRSAQEQDDHALELIEACYGFMAYLAYSELRLLDPDGQIFKPFSQRSIGPLKDMLERCLSGLGKRSTVCSRFVSMKQHLCEKVSTAIRELNDFKHDKRSSLSVSTRDVCERVACLVSEGMHGAEFGYFLNEHSDPFTGQCSGVFRVAHGTFPFHRGVRYQSSRLLSEQIPYVAHLETGRVFSLAPLMLRRVSEGSEDFILVDREDRREGWSFKYACRSDSLFLNSTTDKHILKVLEAMRSSDVSNPTDVREPIEFEIRDS